MADKQQLQCDVNAACQGGTHKEGRREGGKRGRMGDRDEERKEGRKELFS